MRDRAWARWLAAMALSVLAGCAENPMILKGQIDKSRADQLAASRAKDELQNRATRMDRDNQELINQLTQAKQQAKVQDDRIVVLRDQLAASNAQLAQLRDDKKSTEQRVQTLTASLQRQGGTPITANNSLPQTMPSINLPDVVVRRDGDVIRIELPAHRLFEPGGARLLPGTPAVLLGVMGELLRTYPNQIIAVEGHTDSDPIASSQWRNNHQLALARATSVYDVLVYQGQVNPAQLIVVGHGGNAPVLSNSTPTGKKRNARVELVVYPSTVPGR